MKLLILCGQLYPTKTNNTTLLTKLLPYLADGNELRLVASFRSGAKVAALPEHYEGIPIEWLRPRAERSVRSMLTAVRSKLVDRNGYSDAIVVTRYDSLLADIYQRWPFSGLLSITEPFPAAVSGAKLSRKLRTVVYVMDPPPSVRGEADTPYRERCFRKMLKQYNAVFSTPFFRAALSENGFEAFVEKTVSVGFPMVAAVSVKAPNPGPSERISILFTGWMYSDIRSPKYFLDIVSRLDERFVVTFMGRECEKLKKRYKIETRAELITLPQQPYETALQAMADADILINIGNSVPVHMPSKTLEYINTGKPIVNFYKMDDCPTLYYTKRYPLCLNLPESDPDLDAAAERFTDFCLSSRGKTVDRQYIEAEFADCTPEFIASRLLDALNAP